MTPTEPALTTRLRAAVSSPATDDTFDPHGALGELLAGFGMTAAETGGTITFHGADPVVPSTLRLGGAAAITLAAYSATVARMWRLRGGTGQDITVDLRRAPHRLCPFYDRKWELLNGYPPGTPANAGNALGFRFYRTADERWVMPLNPYPKIKLAAQRLLGVPEDSRAVAAAVAEWKGRELEDAAAAAGGGGGGGGGAAPRRGGGWVGPVIGWRPGPRPGWCCRCCAAPPSCWTNRSTAMCWPNYRWWRSPASPTALPNRCPAAPSSRCPVSGPSAWVM
ncbi:hypothetical protein [Nocardia carnea]|uniref:hypothetical protein n=1 Tax=Nocardia carnea TaxID=37328 RepID=UPI0024586B7E|nr:hypothetical protein [Nocardia carnea]